VTPRTPLGYCGGTPRSSGTKSCLPASGVHQMVNDRGMAIGLPDLHRHTSSHAWLADGGSEGDLVRLAG
jgi:hypothetical protein